MNEDDFGVIINEGDVKSYIDIVGSSSSGESDVNLIKTCVSWKNCLNVVHIKTHNSLGIFKVSMLHI